MPLAERVAILPEPTEDVMEEVREFERCKHKRSR